LSDVQKIEFLPFIKSLKSSDKISWSIKHLANRVLPEPSSPFIDARYGLAASLYWK